jgi:predicted ATP-binding protein involved in virulence
MTKVSQEIKLTEQLGSRKEDSQAYFLSIELENVLCFKTRQKLDFSDKNGLPTQWTVILGDNGVGKTTILQCLAGMTERISSETTPSSNEEEKLVSGFHYFKLDFELVACCQIHNKKSEIYTTFKSCSSLRQPIDSEKESLLFSIESTEDRSILFSFSNDKELLGLKCYGYGANRKMGATSLSKVLSPNSCQSLLTDVETLINAEEWLLQADYAVARSAPDNTARLKKRFDLIQDTLKQLLPDISDIRITPADENKHSPMAEFQTPYGWVPLQSLSLGYKTVIAWTVDLAARLIERYPNSADPLAEPAVVLVDEIDLHLHPKWQRTIMSFLTERFPNTQFIVTAHSPLVVQAAKNANIVLLRREGDHVVIDNDPEIIDNWRVEQVLSSVFELPSPHSPDLAPLIERRRKLLAKSKLTAKDERELKKLEAQIGTIPTAESPEDIRAMDIIRKAAKLLENS